MSYQIPVFPLHSVIFPEGVLELRIFETRYIDMVRRVLKEDSSFGICLIKKGEEVGKTPEIYSIGTEVKINYWHQREDGLLGITLKGIRRIQVLESSVQSDRLMLAEVVALDELEEAAIGSEHYYLVTLLKDILAGLGHPYITMPKRFEQAGWVSARLAELLPVSFENKQQLLEINNPLLRIEKVAELVSNG